MSSLSEKSYIGRSARFTCNCKKRGCVQDKPLAVYPVVLYFPAGLHNSQHPNSEVCQERLVERFMISFLTNVKQLIGTLIYTDSWERPGLQPPDGEPQCGVC